MQLATASHYAKALGELVTGADSPVEAREAVAQVWSFEQMVATSHDLRGVLLSPAVSGKRKHAIIAKLAAKAGIAPLIRNFLYVVLDHRRIGILRDIAIAVEAKVDELSGVVRVDVVSASPLNEAQRQRVERELASLSGKHVRMEYEVDAALIGGVRATVGSTVYDGSVRGRLDELCRRLSTE